MSQEDRPRVSPERFEAFLAAVNARDFDAIAELASSGLGFRSVIGGAQGAGAYRHRRHARVG